MSENLGALGWEIGSRRHGRDRRHFCAPRGGDRAARLAGGLAHHTTTLGKEEPHAGSTLCADDQGFRDLRLRRACHRAAADLGARPGVPDPRRTRCAEAHDLVGCRRPPADRQRPRRDRPRLAAQGRHPRHDAGHHQCRPGRQARHPARPQRAQPQPEDGADAGAGRLSRSCRLVRAEAAPQGHGYPGHRSGHDHPDRDRHLSLARGRARRQGVLPRLQRMGLRVHARKSGPAVLCGADPDAAPGLRGPGDPPGRGARLPRGTGASDGCDGQLPAAAEIRAGLGRARRDRHDLRHAPVSRPSAARSRPATASNIPAPN